MSDSSEKAAANPDPVHPLTPAAQRALAEAEQRRREAAAGSGAGTGVDAEPAEHGGRNGPEPTRFGDWEKNGIISDF